jgi:adenylate cyclase
LDRHLPLTADFVDELTASGQASQLSGTVAGRVKTLFELEHRGPITASMKMYFINRLEPEFSRDSDGRRPNEHFLAECNRLLTGFPA